MAAAKEMAENFVSGVETLGVGSQQPFHPLNQVCLRGFHHQVEMVEYKEIAVDLPGGLLTALLEGAQKELTILETVEGIFAVVTTAHHMVNGPWILDAQLPRHESLHWHISYLRSTTEAYIIID